MNGRFVVIGCLLAIWPVLRMLPQLSAAEAVSLDATREIRIAGAAEAGNGRGVVVCAMPAPLRAGQRQAATGTAPERDLVALRYGLFALCEAYRTGLISAADYGSALADFPALVLLIAARAGLDAGAEPEGTAAAVTRIETMLRESAALRTLCVLPVFAPAGPYRPCGLVAAAASGSRPTDAINPAPGARRGEEDKRR